MLDRIKWLLSAEEEFAALNKRYKKLKKDYVELQAQLKDQLPDGEIKVCTCRGYIFRLGNTYIHVSRDNCNLSDGTAVNLDVLDDNLQNQLKKEAGPLKDLQSLNNDILPK